MSWENDVEREINKLHSAIKELIPIIRQILETQDKFASKLTELEQKESAS